MVDWARSELMQQILQKHHEYHLTVEADRGLNIQSDAICIGKSKKQLKAFQDADTNVNSLAKLSKLMEQLRRDFEKAQASLVFDSSKFKDFMQEERYEDEYRQGLALMEKIFEDMAILPLFKPVTVKKNFQFTLNMLKHVYFLQVFKADFEKFLRSMQSYLTKMFP